MIRDGRNKIRKLSNAMKRHIGFDYSNHSNTSSVPLSMCEFGFILSK